MMKKKGLILILTLLFLPITVKALCPYEKQSELKQIASNINYDYSYEENNNGVNFNFRFTNVNPRVYIYDETNNKNYYGNNGEIVINGFSEDKQYKFVVKAIDPIYADSKFTTIVITPNGPVEKTFELGPEEESCANDSVYNIYISTPAYNEFYNEPICKENPSNKLCQKWHKHNFTKEEFIKQVEKTSEKNKEINKENERELSLTDMILNFWNNYYIAIIAVIIILIILVIIIFNKYRKKSDFEGW